MSFDSFDERLYTQKLTEETIQDTVNNTEPIFSIQEVQKMAALIKKGGRFNHIKDAFPYYGSQSDIGSHEAIDKFDNGRKKYYEKLDKLFMLMVS